MRCHQLFRYVYFFLNSAPVHEVQNYIVILLFVVCVIVLFVIHSEPTSRPKDCLKAVMKRLSHSSKNVQLHAVTLLDSCVLNCGAAFHKEVATPEFVKASRNFLSKVTFT